MNRDQEAEQLDQLLAAVDWPGLEPPEGFAQRVVIQHVARGRGAQPTGREARPRRGVRLVRRGALAAALLVTVAAAAKVVGRFLAEPSLATAGEMGSESVSVPPRGLVQPQWVLRGATAIPERAGQPVRVAPPGGSARGPAAPAPSVAPTSSASVPAPSATPPPFHYPRCECGPGAVVCSCLE